MVQNVAVTQRSFASGELSPLLHRRTDIEKFRGGLALCKNCVVLPHGGFTSRSGSRFIAQAQSASRLVPFQFSRTVGYQIELFNLKARFYKDKATILNGGGPYEVTTPWAAADLAGIDWSQSADVLYVVHGSVPETQLRRIADNNWDVVESVYAGGPFLPGNLDESHIAYTTTMLPGSPDYGYIKGTSITLKASSALFTANHVGALFRLEQQPIAGSQIGTWEDRDYAVGKKVRVGEHYYVLVDKNTFVVGTDREPPTHTEGERWTGTDAAGQPIQLWRYMHSGFGWVRITAFTSATEVTADVESPYLPDSIFATEGPIVGGTWRWAEGAWSDEKGYPDSITFHDQRKILGKKFTVAASVIDDFENMLAGTADDEAFQYTIASGEVDDIQWLAAGGRLHVGTLGEEFAYGGGSDLEPLTPTKPRRVAGSNEGSKRVRPVRIDVPVFVALDGVRILRLRDAQSVNERLEAEDLSVLAEHIFGIGCEQIAWQREPYRILWCRLADGTLGGMTYMPSQEVLGCHRHIIENGFVDDISVIRSGAGPEQELWMIVQRTINSASVRYIETLEPFFEKQASQATEDGWFLDCAVLYDGAATATIPGLDHLEGETVQVLADGKVHPDRTVTGGQIALDYTASKVLAGYNFDARARSLPFDGDFQNSLTAEAKTTNHVAVAFRNTVGGKAQCVAQPDDPPNDIELLDPSGGGLMGVAVQPTSGIKEVPVGASWDREGQIDVFQDQPLPMTVLAWTPNRQVA